jgi:hypothetical protein
VETLRTRNGIAYATMHRELGPGCVIYGRTHEKWNASPTGPHFLPPNYAAANADHGPNAGDLGELRRQIPALGLNSARAHSAMARFHAGRAIDFPSRNHRMTSSARTNKNWLISAAT